MNNYFRLQSRIVCMARRIANSKEMRRRASSHATNNTIISLCAKRAALLSSSPQNARLGPPSYCELSPNWWPSKVAVCRSPTVSSLRHLAD